MAEIGYRHYSCKWTSIFNGHLKEVMSYNAAVFSSRNFKALLTNWDVTQIFACAYRPQRNGVAERAHRTVKRVAKRSDRTIKEEVFWITNTRGDKNTLPYELVFSANHEHQE